MNYPKENPFLELSGDELFETSTATPSDQSKEVELFHLDPGAPLDKFDGITWIIRKDATPATKSVQNKIQEVFIGAAKEETGKDSLKKAIEGLVNPIYTEWGHSILNVMAECINYKEYNATEQRIRIHFYRANALAEAAIQKANDFLGDLTKQGQSPAVPALFISLDDMIDHDVFRQADQANEFNEIGFSRLFNIKGEEERFVARPGRKSLKEQISDVHEHLKLIQERNQTNDKVPIVLLEDNVRRPKTIQWIINQMEENSIFDHGQIACIATCFCVATTEDRERIKHGDKQIPIVVSADYKGIGAVDVITTRDLLHDGSVININEQLGRLPLTFMEIQQMAKNLKLDPEKADYFAEKVKGINIKFCDDIKELTGLEVPLDWFTGGQTISKVLSLSPQTPMKEVIQYRHSLSKVPGKNP